MHVSEINGEGELRGQLANPGSPGKMAVKMECMCVQMQSPFMTCCKCTDASEEGLLRLSNTARVRKSLALKILVSVAD